MNLIHTQTLTENQKETIRRLWNEEYPKKLNHAESSDFEAYLEKLSHPYHILLIENNSIKGWYFDFIRENEKWFAMIIDGKEHGKGYGTLLLNLAKEKEPELNGWVIDHNEEIKHDGTVYQSPLEFYRKNGFIVKPQIRLELNTLSAVKMKWTKNS